MFLVPFLVGTMIGHQWTSLFQDSRNPCDRVASARQLSFGKLRYLSTSTQIARRSWTSSRPLANTERTTHYTTLKQLASLTVERATPDSRLYAQMSLQL
jgi:hypothetical protein